MPRSPEQMTEREKKLLQHSESLLKAGMQTPTSLISLEPLTRKGWDSRQRPQKMSNEWRKATPIQREGLMFIAGKEGNEEELRALIRGYLKGMNFRAEHVKQEQERFKEKKARIRTCTEIYEQFLRHCDNARILKTQLEPTFERDNIENLKIVRQNIIDGKIALYGSETRALNLIETAIVQKQLKPKPEPVKKKNPLPDAM